VLNYSIKGNVNKYFLLLLSSCSVLALCGCEETLPLRNDPTNFFTTSLRALYVYNTPREHSFYIYLVVKNSYDETLEAKAAIDGTLRIKWQPPADFTGKFVNEKNVKLSLKDIQTGNYNEKTGTLLFNPGDSLVLMYRWDFTTDDNTDLLNTFQYFLDRGCYVKAYPSGYKGFRKISEKESLEIIGNVKIFAQTAILYAKPLQVNQCFVSHDFGQWDPKFEPCIPIDPSNPCSALQPP
jgi:hypothetical protein